MSSISRRDFLKVSGGVAGGGLLYMLMRAQTARAAVRPPGALDEPEFTSACLRCGRCAVICDTGTIQQGIDGTPHLDGIAAYCNLCQKCTDVCPAEVLLPFDPETVKMGTAELNRDMCIAWEYVGCRLCYERCEDLQQAIWLDDQLRPHVDAELCNGCGGCTFVCPRPAARNQSKKYGRAIMVQP